MAGYVGNFLGGLDQLLTVVGVAIVWLGLSALGGLVAGRARLAELDPIFGWAALAAFFTIAGVFAPLSFATLAAIGAGAAVVAAGIVLKRDHSLVPADLGRLCLLFAPLLLLTSAMVASQWDEFSHWLPTQRYLFESERFPTRAQPETGATYPAYPYAWPLLGYLASRAVGRFLESAGGVLNVMLLLTFGLLTARLMRETLGRNGPGWSGLALGGLAVTLFNPTFVQKVVLTAYADVATAAMVGIGGVLAWRMLDAEAVADGRAAVRLSWHAGLAFLVLVALKQATFVLFALIVAAVVLIALRDPAIRLGALVRLLPGLIAPPLVVYAVWRHHVATELSGREFTIAPLSQWLLALIPEIVWKMIAVLAKKGVYLALMLAAVAFGVRGFVRMRDSFDRFAILVGAVFLGYNGFLLFTYVTAFGEFDALRAASLWRYNMHLGLLGVAFGAVAASLAWRRFLAERWQWSRVAWAPVALLLALPFGFAGKLRFDREPPKPHFRSVAAKIAAMMPAGARIVVLDPGGSGESGVITKYHLDRQQALAGYLSAFHTIDAAAARGAIGQPGLTHVLVHSVTPAVAEATGLPLRGGVSYLLAREGAGWRVVESWPYPPSKG